MTRRRAIQGDNMFKQFNQSVFLLLGLAVSLPSAAAQVTINHTVDLSGVVVENTGSGDYVSKIYVFPPSVQIGSGDAVDMTINFASGQTMQMSDLGLNGSLMTAWMAQDSTDPTNSSVFSIAKAYLDWLDADGNVIRTVVVGEDSSHATHIGVETSNFLNNGESLLFSGYHAYFEVVSLQNDPSHYSGPWLYMRADQLHITAVPEASTYAMMLAGLSLVGAMARGRKQAEV
jgi:hypothetical protein